MAQSYDLILKGGTVVNHDGEGARDLGITAGRIAAIGDLSQASAGETVDCRGLHVLPGVIDTQVHFREPGATHKEDLETGSRSAVMGGVTAVFEMPNTNPTTTSAEALADKVAPRPSSHALRFRLLHRRHAREHQGPAGARAAAGLRRREGVHGLVDRLAAGRGRRGRAQHPQGDPAARLVPFRGRIPAQRAQGLRVEGDPRSHPVWRDEIAALQCTQRLVRLARETGKRVHVLHISTAQEMEFLKDHKDVASVEATPHHLTLEAPGCYERLGTRAQMNPPVRDGAHRAGIWRGLQQGVVDVLGSDHAPHTAEEKAKTYPQTPSGMTGVQTLVPIMLDHVNAGRLSLARFVDLTSAGPARLFGIARKGRIAAGYDADLTVVDLKRRQPSPMPGSHRAPAGPPMTGST